jgi:hypothetical protein
MAAPACARNAHDYTKPRRFGHIMR